MYSVGSDYVTGGKHRMLLRNLLVTVCYIYLREAADDHKSLPSALAIAYFGASRTTVQKRQPSGPWEFPGVLFFGIGVVGG